MMSTTLGDILRFEPSYMDNVHSLGVNIMVIHQHYTILYHIV